MRSSKSAGILNSDPAPAICSGRPSVTRASARRTRLSLKSGSSRFQATALYVNCQTSVNAMFACTFGSSRFATTVFAVGSTTKAFTTALLAMLVDSGRVRWNARVTLVHFAAGFDDGLRGGAGLGVPSDDIRVDIEHRDAVLVGLSDLEIEQVDLAARL